MKDGRDENLTLLPVEQLPQTDEPKKKPRVNCLQDMLLELMDERHISLAMIQKATSIPWATLQGWHDGSVNSQLADRNLLKLAQFFNVSLAFLVYGLGDSDPAFNEFGEGA